MLKDELIIVVLLAFPILIHVGWLDGGKDACVGDSGGPIVRKNGSEHVQLGVVSWGIGCGAPLRPGVYSRVTDKLEWIKSVACTQWKSPATFCEGWVGDNPSPSTTLYPTSTAPTPFPTPSLTQLTGSPTLARTSTPVAPTVAPTKGPDSGVARNGITWISFSVIICLAAFLF